MRCVFPVQDTHRCRLVYKDYFDDHNFCFGRICNNGTFGRQVDRWAYEWAGRHWLEGGQADKHAGRQEGRWASRQADRQARGYASRQVDGWAGRQIGRQEGRQADR